MKVLGVASECYPLVKTGGLADVVGALPGALAPHGIHVTTLLPAYPAVLDGIKKPRVVRRYEQLFGAPARVLGVELSGRDLLLLDAPALFDRPGAPYADPRGQEWHDNWRRFAALASVAADLAADGYDLLHAHDWQAAMAPAYLRYRDIPVPSLLTIHNIAFQGKFGAEIFPELGLPARAWALDGVEYYGGVGFLKAGIAAAGMVTTVSPTYAEEIRSPDFGMGLEGLIAARGDRVRGILNGIDPAIWNPEVDPALVRTFGDRAPARRVANKRAVEKAFGLVKDDGMLFVVISRLTWQKGMDVLARQVDHLVGLGARLAILGDGEAGLAAALHAAEYRHPGRVAIRHGYDEALSHLMQGGGDAILIPSRFEPCGLTQLYGLAYGCVPVVARTGGLADTVIDANEAAIAAGVATGLQFDHADDAHLGRAIERAVRLHARPDVWKRMQQQGMRADFSWRQSGARYAELYKEMREEA